MGDNPLLRLAQHGQSVWLDFISRELVTSGELERLIAEANVTGLTSNPTIFEKAIGHGGDYDEQLRQLVAAGVISAEELFVELAVTDIHRPAGLRRPRFDHRPGR